MFSLSPSLSLYTLYAEGRERVGVGTQAYNGRAEYEVRRRVLGHKCRSPRAELRGGEGTVD